MNVGVEGGRLGAGYEVLSPWADVDPVPLRGLSPRPADLQGKAIGLFSNGKRAASLTLDAVERELQERFPGIRTSRYIASHANAPEVQTSGKAKLQAWLAEVDAVVLSAGD
ncbi:MAG: hypothetical protein IT513_10925 [Burkholderiales bacterium]|nr:hypothetical protein [Burkholderiales bacterium]